MNKYEKKSSEPTDKTALNNDSPERKAVDRVLSLDSGAYFSRRRMKNEPPFWFSGKTNYCNGFWF